MLPNLRFLICGILFCILLFAAAGGGVTLPDSRTHVGEMPEVGRPMMQQSMAEPPVKTQVYMMMVARRSDEPERLREPTAGATAAAAAQAQPNLSGDAVKDLPEESPKPDAVVMVPAGERPAASPPGEPEADLVTGAAPRPGAQPNRHEGPDEAAPPEVAALARPAGEDGAAISPFVSIPLPPSRAAVFNGRRRGERMSHREYSIVQHHNTAHGAPGYGSYPAP